MSKPALGRGLGDLMGKAASPKQLTSMELPESETMARAGVNSLLKGNRENPIPEQESQPVAEAEAEIVVQPKPAEAWFPLWYLFAADVLLVLCSLFLVFRDPATLNWKRMLFACLVTLLGGALAVAGAFMKDQKKED